jgi:hypothetical protein
VCRRMRVRVGDRVRIPLPGLPWAVVVEVDEYGEGLAVQTQGGDILWFALDSLGDLDPQPMLPGVLLVGPGDGGSRPRS